MEDQSRFDIKIGDLEFAASVTGISYEDNKYASLTFRNIRIVLVTYSIGVTTQVNGKNKYDNAINIVVPFYQPAGGILSCAWYPFHCVSNKLEITSDEYYFRSNHGEGYVFKQGHYLREPFEEGDPSSCFSQREYKKSCLVQREYLMNLIETYPIIETYPDPDDGIGIYTAIKRFGNYLHLTTSYKLFGVNEGNSAKAKVFSKFLKRNLGLEDESQEDESQEDESQENVLDEPEDPPGLIFNLLVQSGSLKIETGIELNRLLELNGVNLPHMQEVKRIENSPDALFICKQKMLQIIGEIYLSSSFVQEEEERYTGNLYQEFLFQYKKLYDLYVNGKNENFQEWTIEDMFTGETKILFR